MAELFRLFHITKAHQVFVAHIVFCVDIDAVDPVDDGILCFNDFSKLPDIGLFHELSFLPEICFANCNE